MTRNRTLEDPLAALHAHLMAGTTALLTDQGWRALLRTAGRFHTYSLNNQILITVQAPEATHLAGFGTWKNLGRTVRKGERGIAILAPCTSRTAAATPAENRPDVGAQTDTDPAATGGAGAPRTHLGGFRRAHLFDISQTDGPDLPDTTPALLTGEAPTGLWEHLAGHVATHGYTLERGECHGANGLTHPATRTVRVRDDVEDAQAVRTLAHEVAHLHCGHTEDLRNYFTCQGQCEIEAESVAYIVTAAHGMSPGNYSYPYLATWAAGDLEVIRAAAHTVTTAARAILANPQPTAAAAAT